MATATPFTKARAADSTSTGFTAKIPTLIKPTGAGVFDLTNGSPSGNVPSYLQLLPYGKDTNNDTFDMRLWGWTATAEATPLYIPQLLLDLSLVLGNIDASAIAASTFLVDTITVNKGAAAAPFRDLLTTATDTAASLIVHTRGVRFIEFDFDLAGASEGTAMNCYWRPLEI